MFDIGWTELLVVAVVAIVVVGPKDLPRVLRTLAQTIGKVRRMAGEFQNTFNEALKEAELDELKRDVQALRDTATFKDVRSSLDPIRHLDDQFRSEMSGNVLDSAKKTAAPSPAAAGSALEAMAEEPAEAAPAKPAEAPAGEATEAKAGSEGSTGGSA